jgi:hypothetical protein
MFDRTAFIDLIESAERAQPACPQCGRSVIAQTHDGGIWLECPSLAEHRSFLSQLVRLDFEIAHSRQLLVSPEEALAA